MAFATNYTALRSTTFSAGVNEFIFVEGYANTGDGGEGTFFWDPASTATDNDGTVIKVSTVTTGRWRRVVDEHFNVKWFGAVNAGTGATAKAANRAAIQNACDQVAAMGGGTIFFPTFDYNFDATINLSMKLTLMGDGMLSTRLIYSGTDFAFDFQPPLNQQEIQGVNISRMKIDVTAGGSGIRFNDPTKPFNGTMDFVMRSIFRELYIAGNPTIVTGSRGVQWVKTFDSHIENCHIECFDINIDYQGCDICSIRNNRIKFTKSAAINLFNANSFGTQTEVSHNDILPTANGGSVFISNDPDPKFEFNYVEIGGTNTMASIFKFTDVTHLKIYDNRLEVSAAVAPIWLDLSTINAGYTVDIRNNYTTGVEMGTVAINPLGYLYYKNSTKRSVFTFSGNSRRDGYPFNTQQYQVLSGTGIFSGTPSTDGLTLDNYGTAVRCKNNEFIIPPNATKNNSLLTFQTNANGTVNIYLAAYAVVTGQVLNYERLDGPTTVTGSGSIALTTTPTNYLIFSGVLVTNLYVRVWNADTTRNNNVLLQRVSVTQ